MTDLTIDEEFKNLIPPLSADEFSQLEENILRDGIQDALKIWNGILIDGHNRYDIATRHNLNFTTTEMQFDGRDNVKLWIIQNQLGRRNLPAPVRIKLALLAEPLIAKQAKENSLANLKQNSESDICPTRQSEFEMPKKNWKDKQQTSTNYKLATLAGVSDKTVQRYKKIQQDAPSDIVSKVDKGDMSINAAYNKVKKQEKANERLERKQFELSVEIPADALKLFCADIRDGLPQIADNSVDFIITDPPYPKEYLPLYADLSKVASRILKDGGSLVCMVGQSYLPEVINNLSQFLTYHWCMCYLTPGQTPQLWQKRTNTQWKPLLWFIKGEYKGDWIGNDVMQSPNNDKRFHEWGQSVGGMTDIVERFTDPNQLIVDPFLGGGTTGIAAVIKGRKFIGVDINQSCLDTTEKRIMEAYQNVRS